MKVFAVSHLLMIRRGSDNQIACCRLAFRFERTTSKKTLIARFRYAFFGSHQSRLRVLVLPPRCQLVDRRALLRRCS